MPKVQLSTTPSYVGNSMFGGLTLVEGWDYRALLFSQSNHRLRNGAWSGGGGFYTYHSRVVHEGQFAMPLTLLGTSFGTWQMRGVAGCPTTPPSNWDDRYSSWGDAATAVQSYIPSGYKKTRPGNPQASLGQFLIELRDIPRIPLSGGIFGVSKRPGKYGFRTIQVQRFQDIPGQLLKNLTSLKNLGSEYLNVVFGWKPLLSDLRKMFYLWQNVDKQMAQIIRENGKGIDRRATIEEDTSVVMSDPVVYNTPFVNVYGSVPAFPTFVGTTEYRTIEYSYTRVWYMAKYQYYIPDVGSSLWNARARAALFGALPTPELLWEVLPWSWLVDWFTNVGDIYSNISPNAVDNLVSLYSYTMKHVKTVTSWHATVSCTRGDGEVWFHPSFDGIFSSFATEETKLRFPGGSPYVLNIGTGQDLSPYQLGVVAALGLSRS